MIKEFPEILSDFNDKFRPRIDGIRINNNRIEWAIETVNGKHWFNIFQMHIPGEKYLKARRNLGDFY